jgi:hypothetical protein
MVKLANAQTSEKESDAMAVIEATGAVKPSLDPLTDDPTIVSFREECYGNPTPLRVCRETNTVFNVKILGPRSRNTGKRANDYPVSTQKAAVPVIEGSKVYFDHRRKDEDGARPYGNRNGNLVNVRQEGDSLFADHRYKPSNPLTEAYLWDAEHAPQDCCFSIQANGKRTFDKATQRYVVTEITSCQSVDMVSEGGTTFGLAESFDDTIIPPEQRDFCEHGLSAVSDAKCILTGAGTVHDKSFKLVEVLQTWHDELIEGEIGDELAKDEPYRKMNEINRVASRKIDSAMWDSDKYPKHHDKKNRLVAILDDHKKELKAVQCNCSDCAGKTSNTKESLEMEIKDLTLAQLKESRPDLCEILQGTDAISKLTKETVSLKESLATETKTLQESLATEKANAVKALADKEAACVKLTEELSAIKADIAAKEAAAAKKAAIDGELAESKLPAEVCTALRESLDVLPDAPARKKLIDTQVALLKGTVKRALDTPPFGSTTPTTGERKPVGERYK